MEDITIVGAGLAGLHAARLLALRGARVVLVDRRSSHDDFVHTTGIFVRRTLEEFALSEEHFGPAIDTVQLYAPHRGPTTLRASVPEFRIARMAWLYNDLLERATQSGAAWWPSTSLTSMERTDRGWRLSLDRNRRQKVVETRIVIGADGARSLVARQSGLDRNTEFLVGVEEVHRSPRLASPALHCFIDPAIAPGYLGWIADDGEELHIGVGGYQDKFQASHALASLRKRARLTLPRGAPIERRGGLIPVNGILRRISGPGVFLIGDAAGTVSPLTAGGFDGALRSAGFAADVAAGCLEPGRESRFHEYNAEHIRARFITRRGMRFLMRHLSQAWMVDLGFDLLRIPPLRRLAEDIFFAQRSFPDLSPPLAARTGQPALK